MRSPLSSLLLRATALALVLAAPPAGAGSRARTPDELILGGLDEVFSDDFESQECSSWSASTNPVAAPDGDQDDFGDEQAPTVYCQLPGGFVDDATDCDDADDAVFPGATEVCNEIDDDCDALSPDGTGEPWFGQACDGTDSDLCTTGQSLCVGGEQACSDDAASTFDLCDGADNDCDPSSVDGSEDPLFGTACDGAVDTDLCATGVMDCNGVSLYCTDDAGSTIDLCDGQDNDCDPSSADGSEDPLFGTACDSQVDSDLCATGVMDCNGVSLYCTDDAASALDLCDGQDNDCDATSADGSEDPLFGTACDSPVDTDFCATGTMACNGSSLFCTDDAASTLEVCGNGFDDDCDGQTEEGCP